MLSILRDIVRVEKLRADYKGDVAKIAGQLTIALLANALESAKKEMVDSLTDGLTQEEISLLGNGSQKIPAIKAIRERTKSSLREAKDLVEDYMEKYFGYRYVPHHLYDNSGFSQ